MKKCTLCNIEKEKNCFYKAGNYYQSRCKDCQKKLCYESSVKKRKKPDKFNPKKGEVFIEFQKNYLISNYGRVYRKENSDNGIFNRSCFLSITRLNTGYDKVSIKGKMYLIHRLIAINFIPNPLNKKQVNHINSDRSDNSIDNLEWVSHLENIEHAKKKGRMAQKLNINQVLKIRNSKKSTKELAKEYNVSETNIRLILTNKIWNSYE